MLHIVYKDSTCIMTPVYVSARSSDFIYYSKLRKTGGIANGPGRFKRADAVY